MKLIPLTKGKQALVDDEDYEALLKYKWCFNGNGYAVRGVRKGGGNRLILMHRQIMRPPHGKIVDHINRDKLDNRRANMRLATRSQNQYNRRKQDNNTSGYIGVFLDQRDGAWYTQVTVEGKVINGGRFNDPILAAKKRDEIAVLYHGEFAKLNFKRG